MPRLVSALVWVWVVLLGAALGIGNVLLWPFSNPWIDPRRRFAEWMNGLWGKGILSLVPGVRVEQSGRALAGSNEAYVVCANHQSVSDVIVLLAVFPHMKFVVKRSLFRIPFIGASMWLAGYLASSTARQGPEPLLNKAARWLALGCHVLTFPEGTRSPDGRLHRFHQGPVILAQRAGVKLLPVAISGTRVLLPKHTTQFHLQGSVKIQVLEPMDPTGEPKQVAAQLRGRIQDALDEVRPSAAPIVQSVDTGAVVS